MNLRYADSLRLARNVAQTIQEKKSEAVICPDFISLAAVASILKKSPVALGAQDSAAADFGAHTGEVSPLNLKSLGARYVILGHSERREQLHENSVIINAKIKAALAAKLIPVLCVGERITEKKSGQTKIFLAEELRHALKGVKIKAASELVIAYEPIWAISANKNARPLEAAEADKIQEFIKITAAKILHKTVRILYGGSVNAKNSAEFLKYKNIDGLLVGSASLKIGEFSKICSQ